MEKQSLKVKSIGKIKLNSSGITLIALVVTIVVLMILAGVAVATLMGDNGIIKRAGEAKDAQRGATVQDELTLAIAENEMIDQLNSVNGGQENKKTKTDVVNELVTKGYLTSDDATTLETEDKITIGSVTIDFSRLGSGKIEYSYNNPYIPTNFSHIGTEDWNHGFTIKGDAGTTNENDEFVWVPCVLDQTKVKSGDTVQTFTKITTGKYNSSNFTLHPSGGINDNVPTEDITVAEIRTSVGIYGGFYIAKYEAGISGTINNYTKGGGTYPFNENITPVDGSIKPLSQFGKGVWDAITGTDALFVSKAMIPSSTGTKSTLISGECWDTTLSWITATSDSDYACQDNSSEKGWYRENSSNIIHTTGFYGTNTNNIFDMGGNAAEWTSENCSGNEPYGTYYISVFRGGPYYSKSTVSYPAMRSSYSDSPNNAYSFRVVIYK